MKDRAVLDSSFIASLFFLDNFTNWARKTLKKFQHLATIDYSKVEIFNVAWKRIALFRDDEEVIKNALEKAMHFINALDILDTEDYLEPALKIGLEQKITIYDSLFVVVALRNDSFLLTTDIKLSNKLKKSKDLAKILVAPTNYQASK